MATKGCTFVGYYLFQGGVNYKMECGAYVITGYKDSIQKFKEHNQEHKEDNNV